MDPVSRLRKSPRLTAAVAVALLLGATAAALLASWGAGGQVGGTVERPQVTLYEGGLAFVEVEREVDAAAGEATLTLRVPETLLLPSLRVEGAGVTVEEVRADLASEAILQPGEEVVVHMEGNRSYAGTLRTEPTRGFLLLALEDGGEVRIPQEHVLAVEIPAPPATTSVAGEATVTIHLDVAPEAAGTVDVSYLARGPGWTPSYQLDTETGELAFLATLTGLMDWEDARVDLVSGAPHLVAQPMPGPEPHRALEVEAEEAAAPAADPVTGPTPLGALERYSLREPIDLARGERVRLPVHAAPVDMVRHAYEAEAHVGPARVLESTAEPVPVREVYELRNSWGDPLPPGVVDLYRDGVWIGEDRLPAFPEDARANLTAAISEQIEARLELADLQSAPDRDVPTYELVVENHRDDAVDLRAALTYPERRANLLEAVPDPTRVEGTTVVWEDTLPAGASETYRIQFEVLQEPQPEPEPTASPAAVREP